MAVGSSEAALRCVRKAARPGKESTLSVTVLGPERPNPILPTALSGLQGPVALISAGWRYDEERDEPLRDAIGRSVINLRLYAAFRDIERDAPELVTAHARKQAALKAVKTVYRDAIVSGLAGVQKLWADRRDPSCPWFQQAIRHLQEVDSLFLAQAGRLHEEFAATERPFQHPLVRSICDGIENALANCSAVLVAGGHVGVLRNRMAFFGLDQSLQGKRIFAWSGGAMVLAERILLYHDYTTHGVGLAEYLDRGFGFIPGVVFLPHAEQRLDLKSKDNIAILASRLAPMRAIGLQNGGGIDPAGRVFGREGAVTELGVDGVVRTILDASGLDASGLDASGGSHAARI